MSKRTAKEVRRAILMVLNDEKEHSYGDIERKVNTNWLTVRNHCADLEVFDAITVSDDKVKITKQGRELLRRL